MTGEFVTWKGIVYNDSEDPQGPPDSPEWHKGTLMPASFSVLFF